MSATLNYTVKCYSGVERTQSDLTRAFNLVARKDNWKMPIDCELFRDVDCPVDEQLISDAVVHFTGAVPTFGYAKAFLVRVRAPGYYATIGA